MKRTLEQKRDALVEAPEQLGMTAILDQLEADKAHREAKHFATLRSMNYHGVTIIADHRIRGNDMVILVSPEDYRKLRSVVG